MINLMNLNFYKKFHRFFYPKKKKNVKLSEPVYKDRHKGRNFLILGMGPSVATYLNQIENLIHDKNLIVIGTNNCFKIVSKIDYHVFTSRHRFIDYGQQLNDSFSSKALLSPYIPEYTIQKIYQGAYESIMYINDNDRCFDIQNGIIQCSCKSVALLSIGISIVMGANKIFVAGVDGWLKLIDAKTQLHCNDSLPKYSRQERKQYLNHYRTSQEYHIRVLREISEYLNRHDRKMFSIVTPTEYQEYYLAQQLKY